MPRAKLSSGLMLLAIVGMVILAVLLTPAETDTGGGYSTYSAGPSGMRLAFDLAQRFGWSSEKREVPFSGDSAPAPLQALINVDLGAEEAHALLEHVRKGGGLLVAGLGGSLGDSLAVTSGMNGVAKSEPADACPDRVSFDILRGSRPISPVRWRRPPPADTVGFGELDSPRGRERAATGFPLGAGRVVVVADADFLVNDVMRVCFSESDLAYVGMLKYLSNGRQGPRIAFDEFHHGKGVHGGSLSAIETYVLTTPSGRMLGQVALAGLLLLIAAAPRPLAPRDPTRVARRSPLEHADALAHAYSAVGATRTATARLLAGVRRRVRRGRTAARESDDQILAAATAASPAAASAASLVSRALTEAVPARELSDVAAALSTVEDALSSRSLLATRKS